MPSPKKLKNASSNMTLGMVSVVYTIIGPIALGTMCLKIMALGDSPSEMAASTNSCCLMRQQEFVEAAISLGLSPSAIIFKHIVPNAIGPIIVYTTLTIPSVMLLEAFLSFLGLGIQPPQTSWGLLISYGAETMVSAP